MKCVELDWTLSESPRQAKTIRKELCTTELVDLKIRRGSSLCCEYCRPKNFSTSSKMITGKEKFITSTSAVFWSHLPFTWSSILSILQHLRILRLLCLSYPFFKAPSHASQAGKRQRLWPGMACRESPECHRQNNGTQMSRQCPAKVAKSIANTSENNDIQDHQNKLRSKVDDDRTFRQEHHWILSIIGHDGHAKAWCSRSWCS